MRILLVEDDAMIGAAVEKGLRADGHAVDWARDGKAAETALAAEPYELVLLDLGLPRKDGLAVLKTLRAGGNRVPVIVVTARDAIADRVAGLDAGADDYLVKPFDLDELAARMRAVTRRREGRATPAITHGALTLDPVLHAVTLHGKPVDLSAREFTLLVALLERPGAVLSRAQLEERLYGWNDEIASNAVEVHIHNLRRKLGTEAIENVRGAGYRVGKLN
jgi:two-component system response regulator QseB